MIKNKLKEIRMREYMMTSSEFSKMLNINIGTYSQIENNKKSVSLENAFIIAEKLNKRIEDIWYKI